MMELKLHDAFGLRVRVSEAAVRSALLVPHGQAFGARVRSGV